MASTISAGTTSGTALNMAGDTSGQLQLKTNNGTTAVTIDTSQNVGINVTPSASWAGSGYTALQIGQRGVLMSLATGGSVFNVGTNFYYDGSSYRYLTTDAATQYQQNSGAHNWRIAASGTAGNTLTWTQAMILDSAGNVGIGTSSPASKLDVVGALRLTNTANSANYGTLSDGGGLVVTSANSNPMYFNTGGSERMRIDSSGNVIVSGTSTSSDEATYQSGGVFVSRRASSAGTTHANFLNGGSVVGSITSNTVNTFYNTTSDYRLKENATSITNGLQTISALNPVNFDWISKNVSDTGFLAHEFQAVIPNSVMGTKDAIDENGSPIYQQIDRSGAIPFLVAAIKELNAKVDAQALEIQALKGVA